MVKVIFLDIDGVLNVWQNDGLEFSDNHHWIRAQRTDVLPPLSKTAVARLSGLVERTGARIVISSGWGHYLTPEWIEGFLVAHGLRRTVESIQAREPIVIGRTPKKLSSQRCHEISFWLRDAQEDGVEVESYVALDDEWYGMKELHGEHYIYVDSQHGLQDEHVEQALKVLGLPTA